LRGTKIVEFGNLSRQGAKARSSEGEEQYSYELFSLFFPTFAALASLREIFRVLVAALPRCALRGEIDFSLKLEK
jgi:hypothetical protein